MQGAIFSGLFGSQSPRAFTCPTSSCAWSDTLSMISLGAVGKCENVTQSVVYDCARFTNTLDVNCNVTTPGGFHFMTKKRHGNASFRYTALNVTTGTNRSVEDFTRFAIWRPLEIQTLENFEVLECGISVAAYLYSNITVTNNTMNIEETVVPLEAAGPENPGLNDFRPAAGIFPAEVAFSFHLADLSKIWDTLDEIFNAQVMVPRGSSTGLTADLLMKGNLSRIVENIAWSVTEQIRTGPNSTVTNGTAYESETYIHVNWPWITLPVLVVIGAGTLLAFTVIINAQRRAALWKSSNLAVLLHSVEGSETPASSDDTSLTRIETLADTMRVLRGGNMDFIPRP